MIEYSQVKKIIKLLIFNKWLTFIQKISIHFKKSNIFSYNIYREKPKPSPLTKIWYIFYHDTISMISLYCFIFMILLCLFGKVLAPYDLDQQFLNYQLLPPSWSRYGNISFFLGTDNKGRDILSRLLAGIPYTFGSALIVTISAVLLGLILGVLFSIARGLRSMTLNHALDNILCIPSLLLAIIVVTFLGPCLENALISVWLALLPRSIRTVYTTINSELKKDYILAVRMDGASIPHILCYAMLPNIDSQLISEFTRALSMAIIDISAMGFLNLGAQMPLPEWGAMIADQLKLVYIAPWVVIIPGCTIMLSVLITNILGESIRRAILIEIE